MKPPSIGQTLQEVRRFLESLNVAPGVSFPDTDGPLTMFSVAGQGGVILHGDEALAYFRVGNELAVAAAKNHISREAVTNRLQRAVLRVLDPMGSFAAESVPVRIAAAIKQLRQDLSETPTAWRFAIPVNGLHPDSLPAKFGAIRFRIVTPQYVAAIRRQAAIQPGSRLAGDKSLVGQVAAEVSVEAIDGIAALSTARARLMQHVEVLNFFGDLLCGSVSGWAYLAGEAVPSREAYVVTHGGGSPTFGVGVQPRGPTSLLDLRRLREEACLRAGALKASAILAATNRSAFDARLLTALQWAGRARSEERPDVAFVYYLVALESLVVGSVKGSEIAYRLRLRTAQLLGKTQATRTDIGRKVKALYDLRCALVHYGQADLPEQVQRLAKRTSCNAIRAAINVSHLRRLKSDEHIEEWFDSRALR